MNENLIPSMDGPEAIKTLGIMFELEQDETRAKALHFAIWQLKQIYTN